MKISIPRAIIIATLFGHATGHTQSKEFTPYDWATLPKYCDARIRGDEAAKRMWSDQLGAEIFVHVHHYCFGLHYLNKAKFTFDKRKKNEAINQAIGQFDYVLTRWPKSAPLHAEALRYQQQARSMKQR